MENQNTVFTFLSLSALGGLVRRSAAKTEAMIVCLGRKIQSKKH
jgi:hypothetical protein